MGLEEEKELISFFIFDTQHSINPSAHYPNWYPS